MFSKNNSPAQSVSSKQNAFCGNILMIAGSMFTLSGIYEMTTGEEITNQLVIFKSNVPSIVNYVTNRLEELSYFSNCLLGYAFVDRGLHLKKYYIKNEQNMP